MSESRITRFPEDTGEALSAALTVLDGVAYITVFPTDENGDIVVGGIAAPSERVFDHLERKLDARCIQRGLYASYAPWKGTYALRGWCGRTRASRDARCKELLHGIRGPLDSPVRSHLGADAVQIRADIR